MAASDRIPDGRKGPNSGPWAELFSWLLPNPPEDEQALRALAATASVAALVAAFAPPYALITWWLAAAPPIYHGLALGLFIAALGALLLVRRRRARAAAWLLLTTATFAVSLPFLREGASSPAASNFVIVLVMAALLLGWRAVLVLGAPYSLLVVLVQVAESRGILHAHPERVSSGVFVLLQLTTLTALLVVSSRASFGVAARLQRLELTLARAERMEAVGSLASGVAHDFNSLLTVVLANAELIERAQGAAVQRELRGIRAASRRGSELTKQLLLLSRKQSLDPVVIDLRGVIEELEQLLRPVIPDGIVMEFERPAEPVWIFADPSQISQVVMNLALNARDAMPCGGVLRFGVEVVEATKVSAATPRSRVRLTVSDTGTGMDAATVEHVFEPFFTTKQPGAGTGLGLATVQGIVAQSGGTVRVQSRPGFGSRFEVSLPLARAG